MNNKRIKILQLVPENLPTHRPDVATLFGKSLPELGVTCDIIGKSVNEKTMDENWAGRSWLIANTGSRFKCDIDYFFHCVKILLQINKNDYDVIQVRDMVLIGLSALIISKVKGVPFIFWISYLMTEDRIERAKIYGFTKRSLVYLKGYLEYYLLYKILLPSACHVFVQSTEMKNYISNHGISKDKMTEVPMGVDINKITDKRIKPVRLPGWENSQIIAYLGTLYRLRGLDVLIDALPTVLKEFPNTKLLLIGDSEQSADVEFLLKYADTLGLADKVHVTGWLSNEKAWALLKGSDIACSPFPRGKILDTNSPTKILEYLAMNLPCIGNDSPDQRDVLLMSDAGWLVNGSAQSFAEASLDILRDIPAAKHRAEKGLPFINAHRSYSLLSKIVADIYNKVLYPV